MTKQVKDWQGPMDPDDPIEDSSQQGPEDEDDNIEDSDVEEDASRSQDISIDNQAPLTTKKSTNRDRQDTENAIASRSQDMFIENEHTEYQEKIDIPKDSFSMLWVGGIHMLTTSSQLWYSSCKLQS